MHDCVTDRVVGGKRAECADCLAADLEKTTKAWALAADERDKRGEELKAALLQLSAKEGFISDLQTRIESLLRVADYRKAEALAANKELQEKERLIDGLKKWALEKGRGHRELAIKRQDEGDDEMVSQHIALESAYFTLAEEIDNRQAMEKRIHEDGTCKAHGILNCEMCK